MDFMEWYCGPSKVTVRPMGVTLPSLETISAAKRYARMRAFKDGARMNVFVGNCKAYVRSVEEGEPSGTVLLGYATEEHGGTYHELDSKE